MLFRQLVVAASAYIAIFNPIIVDSKCIDLTPYATNQQTLVDLLAGGRIEQETQAFFDVPGMYVNREVAFCLENITIPDFVDGESCDELDNCYLAVATHSKQFDGDDLECKRSPVNGISGCHRCLCSGFDTGAASLNSTLYAGCGSTSLEKDWTIDCDDVNKRRLTKFVNETSVNSKSVTARVSVCPEGRSSRCMICRGGYHSSFRVGIHWISDVREQCKEHSPVSNEENADLGRVVGFTIGSIIMLIVILSGAYILYYLMTMPSQKTPVAKAKKKKSKKKKEKKVSFSNPVDVVVEKV